MKYNSKKAPVIFYGGLLAAGLFTLGSVLSNVYLNEDEIVSLIFMCDIVMDVIIVVFIIIGFASYLIEENIGKLFNLGMWLSIFTAGMNAIMQNTKVVWEDTGGPVAFVFRCHFIAYLILACLYLIIKFMYTVKESRENEY